MKFEVAIALVIAWFIFRAVAKAIKNNKANLQRGGQNSNNSGNMVQQFMDLSGIQQELKAREAAAQAAAQATEEPTEGHSLEAVVEEKSTRIIDPFLEAASLEDQRGHYNEEALTEEYTTTHAQGKTVAHHKHQLFDPTKDRRKAVHLRGAGSGAGKTNGRAERRVKKVHPIAKALAAQGGRRQGIILAEIMKRPEF